MCDYDRNPQKYLVPSELAISTEEVDKVIFDEVHYINDLGGGLGRVLILCPRDYSLCFLQPIKHRRVGWEISQKMTHLIPHHRIVWNMPSTFGIDSESAFGSFGYFPKLQRNQIALQTGSPINAQWIH